MNSILGFKNLTDEEKEDFDITEDLRNKLAEFHEFMMERVSLNALVEPPEATVRKIGLLKFGHHFNVS